jgi:uncharacterized protein (TIGR02145 family)
MAEIPITQKLQELFDLYNSGALTKDEYEVLKLQVLKDITAESTEADQEPANKDIKADTIKSGQKPEANESVNDKNEADKSHQTVVKESTNKSSQGKKGKRIWIFAAAGTVLTVGAILVIKSVLFTNNPESGEDMTTVKDIDGNVYKTVTIGTQVWMTENLKTTKLNDGTTIKLNTDVKTWETTSTPAYCWYNNDETTYKNTSGALYNWYSVNTKKLCPSGWHVPTIEEWTTLITYLGGEDIAGGKLKETGTIHWTSPNAGASNETGFTALPNGYLHHLGTFKGHGSINYWWSSSEYDAIHAWNCNVSYNHSKVNRNNYMFQNGLSVRCLRDLSAEKSNVQVNNPIANNTTAVWDEASATKITMDELTTSPKFAKKGENDSGKWNHKILGYNKITLNEKELFVALILSENDLMNKCWSVLEFENQDGWKLGKKSIAFTEDMGFESGLFQISPNNYCILLSLEDNAMGGWFGVQQSVYAFIDNELTLIFSLDNNWQGDGYSSNDLRLSFIPKSDGYYDIETHERMPSGNEKALGKYLYKFNGEKYYKDTEATVVEYYSENDNIPDAVSSYQAFADDNIPVDSAAVLREQFLDGKYQHQYSTYSNHTYTLNFNAPYLDEERGYEPDRIRNGIQRAYFINSENVCIQRNLKNGLVVEEIYFHPNGKIYTVINIANGRKNGDVKYVDLDNYVFLQGRIINDGLAGYWDTPVMGNFNMGSRSLAEQYPGVVNSAFTFINFYKIDRDTRQFSMN